MKFTTPQGVTITKNSLDNKFSLYASILSADDTLLSTFLFANPCLQTLLTEAVGKYLLTIAQSEKIRILFDKKEYFILKTGATD